MAFIRLMEVPKQPFMANFLQRTLHQPYNEGHTFVVFEKVILSGKITFSSTVPRMITRSHLNRYASFANYKEDRKYSRKTEPLRAHTKISEIIQVYCTSPC